MADPVKVAGGAPTLEAYFHALPKAELHVHLEGSLPPALLLRLAERNRMRLPFAHPDDFAPLYRYRNFGDFSRALLLGVQCLRTLEDFFDAVIGLGRMLIRQNVRYAEVTWTPQFYLKRGFRLDAILAAMNQARRALEERHGLILRWIPDLVRSFPKPAADVAVWASSDSSRANGVVALGLGGPEEGHPAEQFAAVFAQARAMRLPANPHAGENDGPASVWATLKELQPTRIGHGVRAIEDPALVAHLAEAKVALEVCLTSNVRLGVYPSFEVHPVKQLLDAGCVVTLNSDDPVLFRTTLTHEYLRAVTQCGLTPAQVREAIVAALMVSYLDDPTKNRLIAEFRDEFARLPMPA
jgi:adenosine deaminase